MDKKTLIYLSIALVILGGLLQIISSFLYWGIGSEIGIVGTLTRSSMNIIIGVKLILFYLIVKEHKGMKQSIIPLAAWAIINLLYAVINFVSWELPFIHKIYPILRGGFIISVIAFSLFLILSQEKGKRKTSYLVLAIMSIFFIVYFNLISPYFISMFLMGYMESFYTTQIVIVELIAIGGWLFFYITELNQKDDIESFEDIDWEKSGDVLESLDKDDFKW